MHCSYTWLWLLLSMLSLLRVCIITMCLFLKVFHNIWTDDSTYPCIVTLLTSWWISGLTDHYFLSYQEASYDIWMWLLIGIVYTAFVCMYLCICIHRTGRRPVLSNGMNSTVCVCVFCDLDVKSYILSAIFIVLSPTHTYSTHTWQAYPG